jgi:hypothetical protein
MDGVATGVVELHNFYFIVMKICIYVYWHGVH